MTNIDNTALVISLWQSSDDGGLLSESPYIGRARFHANQMAEEGQVQAVPQRVQLHSLRAPVSPALSPQQRQELQGRLDAELEAKKKEVLESEGFLEFLYSKVSPRWCLFM